MTSRPAPASPGAIERPLERGAFTVSIDVELAWGYWDRLTGPVVERALTMERPIVARLLALFHQYDIVATWAIVGRLLEARTDVPTAETAAWFAPDIVDAIRAATPTQEVGSHSYAHIDYPAAGGAGIDADLDRDHAVRAAHGLGPGPFVYPRNGVAGADRLAAHGIRVYRSVDLGWHKRVAAMDRRAGRAANLADKMLPIPPAVVLPRRHASGLVELPSSMLLLGRDGPRRLIVPTILAGKARLGLETAARDRALFHLWFHPSNFYADTDVQFSTFERILRTAARLRDAGRLDIRPMGSFSDV